MIKHTKNRRFSNVATEAAENGMNLRFARKYPRIIALPHITPLHRQPGVSEDIGSAHRIKAEAGVRG